MNETLWKTLSNIIDFIKYSDAKATAILTVQGVLLTVVFTNADNVIALCIADAISKFLSSLIG